MTKSNLKSINKKIKEIEELKRSMSDLRDKIRDTHDELEGLLYSIDSADTEITEGLRLVEVGIDSLNQYV